jgi:transcriptional regulator with XRE-family HTH domain
MENAKPLGEYLRARRDQVRPEDVGGSEFGVRRVPGLRREELALLAGVSADYLMRLEQGRDHRPSPQVIDALARALQLDDDATAYMHELARPIPRRRAAPQEPEHVAPALVQLLEAMDTTPAMVTGRYTDVLASNDLARALDPCYEPGTNLLRATFLNVEIRHLYPFWERSAADVVAHFRARATPDLDDARLRDLVGELSIASAEFAELWARHDVRENLSGMKYFDHPLVGRLDLHFQAFGVSGADDQTLTVLHPAAGSRDEQSLELLAKAQGPEGYGPPAPA